MNRDKYRIHGPRSIAPGLPEHGHSSYPHAPACYRGLKSSLRLSPAARLGSSTSQYVNNLVPSKWDNIFCVKTVYWPTTDKLESFYKKAGLEKIMIFSKKSKQS